MSDANEKDWNETGRPSGSPGMVNKAGLGHGISSHSQIKDSHASLGQGHGQGQRPNGQQRSSTSHGGRKFEYI